MAKRNYTGKNNSCYRHGHATGLKNGNKIQGEYRVWLKMRERCISPSAVGYENYGGRGIKICDRWIGKDGFSNFLTDMGNRPSPKYSLDRIDNNGNYEPENCRWATRIEQNRNSRNNTILTYNGRSQCIAEWAEEFGLNYETFLSRIMRLGANKALSLGSKHGGKGGVALRDKTQFITYNGETLCVADWAKKLGMYPNAIFGRLKRGWSIEKTLSTPRRIQKIRGKEVSWLSLILKHQPTH